MTQTISKVPMLDLHAQYEPMKKDVLAAIEDVLDSKQFIQGPKVTALEKQIAEYCGVKEAIGVTSGTDALIIALMALGIGAGDEVITTPFTFFATVGSISRLGATPVFVDIDPETYNINPEQIEAKITSKTKAIIPVHLFGQMADMDPIMDSANKHNLVVIEDAAQAIGSRYRNANGDEKCAGSIGKVGCFSFFPSKNLGACGDGGIVTTNDEELAKKIRALRVHGSQTKYYHDYVGGNFRLDPLQAAILLVKLPYLNGQHEGRRHNAGIYNDALNGVVTTPYVDDRCYMIYNQYTIRTEKREAVQQALTDANIGNAIYYPLPLHLQVCFKDLGYKEGDFPESEKAANEVLSIPVYPELDDDQKDYVVSTIKNAIG